MNELFEIGDTVKLSTIDCRLWKRFWHWITFRKPPIIEEYVTVTKTITHGNEITLEFNSLKLKIEGESE